MTALAHINIVTNDPAQQGGVLYLNKAIQQALESTTKIQLWSHSSTTRLFRRKKSIPRDDHVLSFNLAGLPVPIFPCRSFRGRWWSTLGSPALVATGIYPEFVWISSLLQDERPHHWATTLLKRNEERVLRNAKVVWANSQHTSKRVLDVYGIEIETVHPPLLADIPDKPTSKNWTSLTKFRVLIAGRLDDPRKNMPEILRAFRDLDPSCFEVEVIGYSAGKNDGTYPHVCFSEPKTRTAYLESLRKADIFIMGSLQEGFGITSLEALASGCWVVYTPCGGPEGLLKDRGVFVPQFDSNAILQGILLAAEKIRAGLRPTFEIQDQFSFSNFKERIKRLLGAV